MFTHYTDIDWPDLFKPIMIKGGRNRIRVNKEIIPIIFVPGIMGSRLKNKKTGQVVWDPDAVVGCMLWNYGGSWNSPADRKKLLIGKKFNPDHLDVDLNNPLHNRKIDSFWSSRHSERGWGGVMWGSYGEFLIALEKHKWDNAINQAAGLRTRDIIGKCFEFPVFAFGYNWTDSNQNSGRRLAKKIDSTIASYKSKGRLCKYVILISHSMGGIVCRSACMLHKAAPKVLGVIHGVQPATGAAAGYWRMKAGFERTGTGAKRRINEATACMLGTNGEEVTCILGNSPGGLELLPNHLYRDNNGSPGWLHVPAKNGREYTFPCGGDPYREIYKVKTKCYWRLITPQWLDPILNEERQFIVNYRIKSWDHYLECLEKAETFHRCLKDLSHETTYQFYSSKLKTVDKIEFERKAHILQQFEKPREKGDLFLENRAEPCPQSTSRGNCVMYVDDWDQVINAPIGRADVISMLHPEKSLGVGDGTVPDSSGNALKAIHSQKLRGIEHQGAFEDPGAIAYVFKVITNLALKRIREGEVTSAR